MLLTDDIYQPYCSFVPIRDWSLSRPATIPETREPGKPSVTDAALHKRESVRSQHNISVLILLAIFKDGE